MSNSKSLMTTYILTYGTLRYEYPTSKGFGLHDEERAKYLGQTSVLGGIYSLGGFPGWKNDNNGHTVCDMFEVVDQSIIKRLDYYEGYLERDPENGLYNKCTLRVPRPDTGELVDAVIYEYNGEVDCDYHVDCGNWIAFLERKAA